MQKRIVVLMVDDESPQKKEVKAFSNTSANIFISTATMQEALTLLQEAIPEAQKATELWQPTQEEEQPIKKGKSFEEEAAEFEATPAGKRFVKQLQNARQFEYYQGNGGLRMSELDYLACIHHDSLIDGCFDIYSLAFRSGYNKGMKRGRAYAGNK